MQYVFNFAGGGVVGQGGSNGQVALQKLTAAGCVGHQWGVRGGGVEPQALRRRDRVSRLLR